ncbi:MAG: hypothetical protein Q7R93_03075 [bacterium]|nr:hypothetical protein [bacterium]
MKRFNGTAIPEKTAESFFTLLREGRLSKIRAVLEANPALISARDKGTGYTPLHFALEFGEDRLVTLLSKRSADFEAVATGSGTKVRELAKWHKREHLLKNSVRKRQ